MRQLRRAALLLIPSMLAVYAVMGYQVRGEIGSGYSDFISAYTAAKILQRGERHRLYDLPLQTEIQRATGKVAIRSGALPFVRPPFEAWLFRPLASLSYPSAFVGWTIISLGFLVAAMALLRREVPLLEGVPMLIAILGAISYFPVFFTFVQGQDSLLLLLIYVLSYRFLRRGSRMSAGATLALGTFKFPLVVPFLVPFVLRGRIKFVAGFAVVVAALLGVSVATVGWSGMREYVVYLANIDRLARGVNVARDMANLRGLLAVLTGNHSSITRMVVLSAVSVAVLGITAAKWKADHQAAALPLAFSLNMVATLLVSYHAHVFDLALLVIPICMGFGVLGSDGALDANTRRLLAWSIALTALSPLYILLMFSCRCAGLIALVGVLLFIGLGRALSHKTSVA